MQVEGRGSGVLNRLNERVHALTARGNRGDDGDVQGGLDELGAHRQPAGAGFIHHVEGQHLRNAHFGDLDGQQQGAAQVLGIANLQDGLQRVAQQHLGGDPFILAAGGEADDAWSIQHHNLWQGFGQPLGNFYGGAGIVGDHGILPGQAVEENGFSDVGVADQGDFPTGQGRSRCGSAMGHGSYLNNI